MTTWICLIKTCGRQNPRVHVGNWDHHLLCSRMPKQIWICHDLSKLFSYLLKIRNLHPIQCLIPCGIRHMAQPGANSAQDVGVHCLRLIHTGLVFWCALACSGGVAAVHDIRSLALENYGYGLMFMSFQALKITEKTWKTMISVDDDDYDHPFPSWKTIIQS